MEMEFKPVLIRDYFRHVVAIIMFIILIPVILGIKPEHGWAAVFYAIVCIGWLIYTCQAVIKIRVLDGDLLEFVTIAGKTKVKIQEIKKIERVARWESSGGNEGGFEYYTRFVTAEKIIRTWYDDLGELTAYIAAKNPEADIRELTEPYKSEFYKNEIRPNFLNMTAIAVIVFLFFIVLVIIRH